MSPEQASGQPRGLPLGPVHAGRDPLRDGDGQAGLPEKDRRRDAGRDHPEEPEPLSQARAEGPGARALDRRALPRQGPRGALRLDQGPRARPQERPRPPDRDLRSPAALEAAEPAKARRRGWLLPALAALAVGLAPGCSPWRSSDVKAAPPLQFQQTDLSARRRSSVGALRARRPDDRLRRRLGGPRRSRSSRRGRTAPSRGRSVCRAPTVLVGLLARASSPISLNRHFVIGYEATGTLARVPLAGGAPREVLESVAGRRLVARRQGAGRRAASSATAAGSSTRSARSSTKRSGWVSNVRVSPDGRCVAFFDHPQRGDNDGLSSRSWTRAASSGSTGPFRQPQRRRLVAAAETRSGRGRDNRGASSLVGKVAPVWIVTGGIPPGHRPRRPRALPIESTGAARSSAFGRRRTRSAT